MIEHSNICGLSSRLRAECREDEVAFSEVLRAAREITPPIDPLGGVALLVEAMLDDGDVRFGQWHPTQLVFLVWSGTAQELLARIISSWREMSSDPQPGDIGWFSAVNVRDIPYAMEDALQRPTGGMAVPKNTEA